ncbi:cyclodeaminase/cyclohydrolase family protein [Agreia pratensis]|uniref:Formiminotetrahydrofolate cyclodeaminase n=1 Tax=Agreia pratensis TaxID=150121 RepID=A0A1X7KPC8_9MICO|nr:cyclodeaminase/cyclohydrolase family protein [Agreia pratensis]MBF4635665.1 cyclodeaminase/cyclohydrolase family protein [Agreia pratensis]SMG43362.1 Formiminotetrahydrofolate cyclodeaminase [Agreia pratensis]
MHDSSDVTTRTSTVDEWTRALAGTNGSPGGGAGAGVMLAIAASLMSMVAGYSERADGQSERRAGGESSDLSELRARAHSLREDALRLADEDSAASSAFGAAYRLEKGPERDAAVRAASVDAARASSILGRRASEAVDDLELLALHGNPALIADVVVALGALRAAITGARTNVSFDLAAVSRAGESPEQVREENPEVWSSVTLFDQARDRIDAITAAVDDRAAPTDHE